MLGYDDPRWKEMKGGYKVIYDPRPALRSLEKGVNLDAAWDELWNELHHQGDVGEASNAAIPHLVRIQKQTRNLDWNLYALVSTIETQRHAKNNPALPGHLKVDLHVARGSRGIGCCIRAIRPLCAYTTNGF